MGTWGMAKDMAKINEENLSKLSRKGMYEKLSTYGSYSSKKIYRFRKASPELLNKIKSQKGADNKKSQTISLLLAGAIAIVLLSTLINIL